MKRFLTVVAVAAFSAGILAIILGEKDVRADNNYFALSPITPFVQDWSDINQITMVDDWSGVASINGYLGDRVPDLTPGIDPQTIVVPSATIDVSPNQSNPALFSTGGVAEFDRAPTTDFVVALQGSGTADSPYIDILLNTTACPSPANVINISYNVRDIDGSVDNAVQQVALQYRVGNTGDYTNIPAGYIADATTGPNLATLVTPVLVTLPASTQGQSQIHLRIMTANAVGTDEWVGIDDIRIACRASTAAEASLGGRVVTASGRGIHNALVTISGGGLSQPRIARTGAFGYYRFDDLQVGETYVVTVSGKRFLFDVPSRVVSLNDQLADIDFVANP